MNRKLRSVAVAGIGRATSGLRSVTNLELAHMLRENGTTCKLFWFGNEQKWLTWWLADWNKTRREKAEAKLVKELGVPRPENISDSCELVRRYRDWLWYHHIYLEFETSDEWIVENTGIHSRHHALPGVATSDLAVEAGLNALADAKLDVEDVDGLFIATVSPDHPTTPPTVSLVAEKMGIRPHRPSGRIWNLAYDDSSVACCSFMVAFRQACNAIMTGQANVVTVIGADKMTDTNSRWSRNLFPILADGAGSLVLVAGNQSLPQFASTIDGSLCRLIMNEYGGSAKPITVENIENPFDQRHLMAMAGPTVLRWVCDSLLPNPLKDEQTELRRAFIPATLAEFGHPMESWHDLAVALNRYDLFALHQANMRINLRAEEALRELGYKGSFHDPLPTEGNPTSAAIPLVLHSAREQGILRPRMRVAAYAFGGGGTEFAADFRA